MGVSEIANPGTFTVLGDAEVVQHLLRAEPPRSDTERGDRMVSEFGRVLTSRQLADEYDLTDVDGSRPDCWGYIETYGIEEQSGKDVERSR